MPNESIALWSPCARRAQFPRLWLPRAYRPISLPQFARFVDARVLPRAVLRGSRNVRPLGAWPTVDWLSSIPFCFVVLFFSPTVEALRNIRSVVHWASDCGMTLHTHNYRRVHS